MCISDSEAEDARLPVSKLDRSKSDLKAARHSFRGEALKDVDYSTRHHPQDEDIPGFRKRRTAQSEEGNATACISSAKRRKTVKMELPHEGSECPFFVRICKARTPASVTGIQYEAGAALPKSREECDGAFATWDVFKVS